MTGPTNDSWRELPDTDWLLHEEKQFVAFFRPRCGSTTLTRWFFENMGYKFGGFSIAGFRVEWMDERRERLTRVFEEDYDQLHSFVVVRNPFDRAVSSYLHAVNNPRDFQWDIIKQKLSRPGEKHELTFRRFVDFLAEDDLDTATTIWRRQSALVCWDRGVKDVVPLEQMDDYLLALNARYGFGTPPSRNSVTVANFGKPPSRPLMSRLLRRKQRLPLFADTPFEELLQFKGKAYFEGFPNYRLFYDDELRHEIGRLYEKDITIFRTHIGTAELV